MTSVQKEQIKCGLYMQFQEYNESPSSCLKKNLLEEGGRRSTHFHLLVHSPNGHNALVWAGLELEARHLIQVFHVSGRDPII